MPLLILAGLPLPVINRNKRYRPIVANWKISIIPARNPKRGDLFSCWNEVLSLADTADDDGVHILAYHFMESDYPKFFEQLYDRHRLIWLQKDAIREYGGETFTKLINCIAQFETQWRMKLRPRGVDAATLLPETSFTPIGLSDMWRRVRTVGVSRDSINQVSSLVGKFRDLHYIKGTWRDGMDLDFEVAHEQHRQAAVSQRWKFTFLTPPSHHYNVKCRWKGREFTITDMGGVTYKFGRYSNVSCHGLIWGGE